MHSFFRNVPFKTFQRVPCLWPSCKPLWFRPRTIRSRSELLLSLKKIPSTGESRLNGLILWTGTHMRVPFCSSIYTNTFRFDRFLWELLSLIYCVYSDVKNMSQTSPVIIIMIIIYSVLCVLTAAWSLNTLIYVSISVFVATVFCILYCTIPACQRCFVYVFCIQASLILISCTQFKVKVLLKEKVQPWPSDKWSRIHTYNESLSKSSQIKVTRLKTITSKHQYFSLLCPFKCFHPL